MLERFRKDGVDAEPVVIGARRRPEAVVLSYERYLELAGGRQRVAAALDRQAREAGQALDADEALELANLSCTRCASSSARDADSAACVLFWTQTSSSRR